MSDNVNKQLEQLDLSTSNNTAGRDLSIEDGKLADDVFQSRNSGLNIDVGSENVDESDVSSSSNKGGLFTIMIPLKQDNSNLSTDLNIINNLETKTKHTIQLTISKLSSLRQKMTTSYHYIANLPWRMAAKTECSKRTGNVKYFSVYIDCNPESESTLWSCDAVVEFCLISQQSSGTADFTRQFTNKFNFHTNNWGFPSFMEWSEITKPEREFVCDDKVIIKAHIIVKNVVGVRQNPIFCFTSNQDIVSDGILIIDKTRLYVSKQYLALYSPVFRAMFYSNFNEREMSEIPLEDVILDEFIEMLNVIYPSHAPITTDSVEYLLELGDKFEIQYVINECEKFLMQTEDIIIMVKLVWADQYCLSKLQDICMRSFKGINQIKALRNSEVYRTLSDTTKAAILEKVLKFV